MTQELHTSKPEYKNKFHKFLYDRTLTRFQHLLVAIIPCIVFITAFNVWTLVPMSKINQAILMTCAIFICACFIGYYMTVKVQKKRS